jgi:predicted DCC family thiol-disulfide oxidoreductase YuxK
VLAVPAQASGVRERYGLTEEDTDRAAWAIDRDGRRLRGAAAINRALAVLPGAWPRLAALYRVPPLRWAEDLLYELVARTRHWLGYLTRTPPEIGR